MNLCNINLFVNQQTADKSMTNQINQNKTVMSIHIAEPKQRFLIQTDKEISSVERAAFYLLDFPCVRSTLQDLLLGVPKAPDKTLCPVGSVEFFRAWLYHLELHEPEPIDYPQELEQFLGRDINQFNDVKSIPPSMFPVFVKPVATKAWTGFVANKPEDIAQLRGSVWTSSVVEFREEFRAYVQGKRMLFVSRYDDLEDGCETPSSQVMAFISDMIDALSAPSSETRLDAYALDVGVCADGEIRLIELTDAWACGLYRPDTPKYQGYRMDYFKWLYARWGQIAELGLDQIP